MWTRDPVPACADDDSGGASQKPCNGTQFKPPVKGLYGFLGGDPTDGGPGAKFDDGVLPDFAIIDVLQVPATLPVGDYVLQYRYGKCSRSLCVFVRGLSNGCTDCEQTTQVWCVPLLDCCPTLRYE